MFFVGNGIADLGGARAVYLTRLQRLSSEQRRALIDGLNAAGVPTFSMLGHQDVELGALAGVTPDIESQVVLRVALNLGRLMRSIVGVGYPTPLPLRPPSPRTIDECPLVAPFPSLGVDYPQRLTTAASSSMEE